MNYTKKWKTFFEKLILDMYPLKNSLLNFSVNTWLAVLCTLSILIMFPILIWHFLVLLLQYTKDAWKYQT